MARINAKENEIVIKNPFQIFIIGIGAICMVGVAAFEFFTDLEVFADGFNYGDLFGLVFICLWCLVGIGIGITALIMGSEKIIIDNDGVERKSWFSSRKLAWCEVQDWGLSYCGQTRGEGDTYYLYFSKNIHKVKNKRKKKLKGKMIKTIMFEDSYMEVLDKIVSFCTLRTSVEPFLGDADLHIE